MWDIDDSGSHLASELLFFQTQHWPLYSAFPCLVSHRSLASHLTVTMFSALFFSSMCTLCTGKPCGCQVSAQLPFKIVDYNLLSFNLSLFSFCCYCDQLTVLQRETERHAPLNSSLTQALICPQTHGSHCHLMDSSTVLWDTEDRSSNTCCFPKAFHSTAGWSVLYSAL